MLKKDKTKPFRVRTGSTDPESPTDPIGPSVEDMLKNCAISKLKADRTPIPDNRFTLPPEYGVNGGGSSDAFNGHEYVDLGLPSGTLWAKMNVGAESETDYGLYFAWGETEGYADASTKAFSWSDYKWTEDDGDTMSKYNATDGLTHLELVDDAAAVNMGGDWHMPNRAQCIELFKETKNGYVTDAGAFMEYTWSDNDGYSSFTIESPRVTISGWNTVGYFFFKSDVDDIDTAIANGDYLFIPAAGSYEEGEVDVVSDSGYIWASALISRNVATNAYYFGLGSINARVYTDGARYIGQSVRGVVGQMDETTPVGGGESGPK